MLCSSFKNVINYDFFFVSDIKIGFSAGALASWDNKQETSTASCKLKVNERITQHCAWNI